MRRAVHGRAANFSRRGPDQLRKMTPADKVGEVRLAAVPRVVSHLGVVERVRHRYAHLVCRRARHDVLSVPAAVGRRVVLKDAGFGDGLRGASQGLGPDQRRSAVVCAVGVVVAEDGADVGGLGFDHDVGYGCSCGGGGSGDSDACCERCACRQGSY